MKNQPYRFEITSVDVNHAFNIPDFTVLMDAIPSRVNTAWVVPDKAGEYLIQCREYCGFSHYQMRAKLVVEEPSKAGRQAKNFS
jgi:cytochrome c oxidase subunit 2